MHFGVLVIAQSWIESWMDKRNYEACEEEGADIQFCVEIYKADAEKEYKEYVEANGSEEIPDLASYMEGEHPDYVEEDGNYGYMNNILGIHDWYEIGGRWDNTLPKTKNEKELQKSLDKALDLSNEKIAEKYRNKADEYVELKSMTAFEACAKLGIGGCSQILISDKMKPEHIINWWRQHISTWDSNKKDAVKTLFYNMLIEDNYNEEFLEQDEFDDQFFIEQYNHFVKLNKKGAKYYLTVVDCHA